MAKALTFAAMLASPWADATFVDPSVQLFEWSWPDVANECETFLAPKGYKTVQISPPMEHIQGSEWWTRYQPVSYSLTSRSGNETQFSDMVSRCNKVVGRNILHC
jgi:alpha-amylase